MSKPFNKYDVALDLRESYDAFQNVAKLAARTETTLDDFWATAGKSCCSHLPFSRFEVNAIGGKSCFAELGTKNSREPTLQSENAARFGFRERRPTE